MAFRAQDIWRNDLTFLDKNLWKILFSFSGEILSDVNFTFIFNTKFQNELLNSSSNAFRTMEDKIRVSVSTSFFEVIY